VGFCYWVLLGLSTSLGETGAIPSLHLQRVFGVTTFELG
jgi:hypothetical protein